MEQLRSRHECQGLSETPNGRQCPLESLTKKKSHIEEAIAGQVVRKVGRSFHDRIGSAEQEKLTVTPRRETEKQCLIQPICSARTTCMYTRGLTARQFEKGELNCFLGRSGPEARHHAGNVGGSGRELHLFRSKPHSNYVVSSAPLVQTSIGKLSELVTIGKLSSDDWVPVLT